MRLHKGNEMPLDWEGEGGLVEAGRRVGGAAGVGSICTPGSARMLDTSVIASRFRLNVAIVRLVCALGKVVRTLIDLIDIASR